MRAPRGRRVGSTHSGGWGTGKMTSFPRMARVFGAPRGRRVETEPELPSNTTNIASVEYIEAIFDTVSVTIATYRQHKICLFFHKIVYILKTSSVTYRFYFIYH